MISVVSWDADGIQLLKLDIRLAKTVHAAVERGVTSVVFTNEAIPDMPSRTERMYSRSFVTPKAVALLPPGYLVEPLPSKAQTRLIGLVPQHYLIPSVVKKLAALQREEVAMQKRLLQIQGKIVSLKDRLSRFDGMHASDRERRVASWHSRHEANVASKLNRREREKQARAMAAKAQEERLRAESERLALENATRQRYESRLSALFGDVRSREASRIDPTLDMPVLGAIQYDMDELAEHEREVFLRRVGLSRPLETRTMIGEALKVTDKRVKQIEEEVYVHFASGTGWPLALRKVVAPLLPAQVSDLASQWWAHGLDEALVESVARFAFKSHMGIVETADGRFMTAIDETTWFSVKIRARESIMRARPDAGFEECLDLARAELGGFAQSHGHLLAEILGFPSTEISGWRKAMEGAPTPRVTIERVLADPAPLTLDSAYDTARGIAGPRVVRRVIEAALKESRVRMPDGSWVPKGDAAGMGPVLSGDHG